MSWPSDDSLRVKGDTAVIATPESTSAARRLLPDTQQKNRRSARPSCNEGTVVFLT
jgi:hypothetical protein